MKIRTYSELMEIPTFLDRYFYLKLGDRVGVETFGFDRYLNQQFYRSKEWRDVRNFVISRDLGCDLAIADREIPRGIKIYIHHMNPLKARDIIHATDYLLDPEFLITTTKLTHDAIHYGDESLLLVDTVTERTKNDTCPWRI